MLQENGFSLLDKLQSKVEELVVSWGGGRENENGI